MLNSNLIRNLINSFSKIPSIGSKMAEKMTLYISQAPQSDIQNLVQAIESVRKGIVHCSVCHHFSETSRCDICSDTKRDKTTLCIVERQEDLLCIERSKSFKGIYHILNGVLSPMDGITPRDINIGSLMSRFKGSPSIIIQEVIIATNPTVNGELTATYISKALKSLQSSIKISRIGFGVAIGSELSYVDKLTMTRSLESRTLYGDYKQKGCIGS